MTPPQLLSLRQVINIPSWRFFITVYKLTGLWPPSPDDERGSLRRRLYFCVATLGHSFFTFLYITTMLINIAINLDVNNLYISLTEFAMLGKAFHFLGRHLKFQAFIRDLFDNPTYALRDEEELRLYKKNLRHYAIIINVYMVSCVSVIVSAGLSSYFSDPITLPYPAWFPFDYSSSRNLAYYTIFLYQNFGMTMHCFMNLTWDCIMPYLMMNLRSQFEVLGHRLRQGFTEPKNHQKTREEIVANINHYNSIVAFNQELRTILSVPLALQISVTGIVLCVTMMILVTVREWCKRKEEEGCVTVPSFQMTPDDSKVTFLYYLFYIVCMLLQIYLQCYFGSLAALESEKMLHSLFCANWLDVDMKNRKLLLMFMIRLKEASRIKTMKVFFVDRATFMSVSTRNLFMVDSQLHVSSLRS